MPSKSDKIRLTREQDKRVRITDKQRRKIILLYESGMTQAAVAEKMQVSKSSVCYIVSKRAAETLRDYRKVHPPKRRTREEMNDYMKDLRSRKKKYHEESI